MVLKIVLRKLLKRQKKIESKKEHKVLKSWGDMYEELQEHPLTQAKILNEQLLRNTNESIDKIHDKLDLFENRITRLENRKVTVKKTSNKGAEKEVITEIVDKGQLSEQEELIIKMINDQGEVDAKTISKKFNISRGNASLKLNKLHKYGLLAKRLDEKSIFFKIK
jgi:Fic family protein